MQVSPHILIRSIGVVENSFRFKLFLFTLHQMHPIKVRKFKVRSGTHGAVGWMHPQTGSYLLYLWQDGLPSGHKGAFLQRAHTAGWGVNSLFLGAAGGAFPSRWNGLSSESLFYSLESWGRWKGTFLVCHSVDNSRQDRISAIFHLQ